MLTTEVERRCETLANAEKAGRSDLLKQEQAELDVVLSYLPKQMSREEVAAIAQQVVDAVGVQGPPGMGKVIGRLMPQLKGKADGKLINEVAKELLAG